MNAYQCKFTTLHNGKVIDFNLTGMTLLDEIPENKTINITWDNLEEVYKKYGLNLSFSYAKCKKGRVVYFFTNNWKTKEFWCLIKEWKTPNLNIEVKLEYRNINMITSIKDILEYHNSEKAIQYLKERNKLDVTFNLNK